jgi:glycosyltransferase involved in cell wall biosynthesis
LIDVFVVPRKADFASDYVTPLKPFEALALKCPLIISDRPVAREIVGKNERGLTFRTGEPNDLARVIRTVLDNPDMYRQLVETGAKWVYTQRTWQQNTEMYRQIYTQVVDRWHGDRRIRKC